MDIDIICVDFVERCAQEWLRAKDRAEHRKGKSPFQIKLDKAAVVAARIKWKNARKEGSCRIIERVDLDDINPI